MAPRTVILLVGIAAMGCAAPSPPNIVFMIIDDMGWTDAGVLGSTFYETPHLDRLAAEGVRFTNFYTASPVCSPTRASLMTGRHPARLHLTNWIGGEQQGQLLQAEYVRQLPLAETTFGEVFRDAGYATGYIGKWHLGDAGYFPEQQGFGLNIGGHAAGQPGSYFYPYENERLPWSNVPGLSGGQPDEYLTDRLTEESLQFIRDHRDGPFLLVLSHYAVHTPLQAKPATAARYERKAVQLDPDRPAFASERGWGMTRLRQDHAVYAGMIESMDESVGRMLTLLDSLGITEETVFVFVSDNGGLSTLRGDRTTAPTANLPLRAGKGWLYEGGIRAPLIIRWPGRGARDRVVDVPATTQDLFPTLLTMAGLDLRPALHLDGVSLAPLLTGGDALPRSALFWHFPHYHGSGNRPSGAVRQGRWKLVEWFEDGEIELFDLAADLGETTNLADSQPDVARGLREQLHAWRDSVGARMPTQNPDWRGR